MNLQDHYIIRRTKAWCEAEDGNVTIDWTVLLAGLVGLSLAVMLSLGGGTTQLASKIDTELSARDTLTY